MTLEQIRDIATEMGITCKKNLRRTELLRAIQL
jgi:hypothetical protein